MTGDPSGQHRRSVRLPGFDYAKGGAYFITLCTRDRACLFGDVTPDGVVLNEVGLLVREEWERSPAIRPNVEIDAFIVMPNHLHGIVVFYANEWCAAVEPGHARIRPARSLGSFIAGFKAATSSRVKRMRDGGTMAVWQRNYYEHVIRSERSLEKIREYIWQNPARWMDDPDNPMNIKRG